MSDDTPTGDDMKKLLEQQNQNDAPDPDPADDQDGAHQ